MVICFFGYSVDKLLATLNMQGSDAMHSYLQEHSKFVRAVLVLVPNNVSKEQFSKTCMYAGEFWLCIGYSKP